MDWFEKEEAYDRIYASGKQAKDLWQYIPSKLSGAVSHCDISLDGYWIYLNEGWSAYDHGKDCGIIHEYNIPDLKDAIKTIAFTNRKAEI